MGDQSPMGSDSWVGAAQYAPKPGEDPVQAHRNSLIYRRATAFFFLQDWDFIKDRASEFRGGVPCQFRPNYTLGNSNMIRRLDFIDGVSWVARVRMHMLRKVFGLGGLLPATDSIMTGVAGLMFLRTKTHIPVPELYFYDSDPDNKFCVQDKFCAPYMLMTYFDGCTATDLRAAKGLGLNFGNPEQDALFRQKMAMFQAELSMFQFDKIGSLRYNDQTGKLYIGRDQETGKGPWKSTTAYFNDIADHAANSAAHVDPQLLLKESFLNPFFFKLLIKESEDVDSRHGPFYLANLDFGPHNILVNEDFDILSVIDLDSVKAVPVEAVAQYPFLSDLINGPRINHTMELPELPRIGTDVLLFSFLQRQYCEIMKRAEDQLYGKKSPKYHLLTDALVAESTIIFTGLISFGYHRESLNALWQKKYTALQKSHKTR